MYKYCTVYGIPKVPVQYRFMYRELTVVWYCTLAVEEGIWSVLRSLLCFAMVACASLPPSLSPTLPLQFEAWLAEHTKKN